SPSDERMSWRCVPSAQSKRSRSPPRRMRSAAGARPAVGALADVPRKTMSRSTGDRFSQPAARQRSQPALRQDETFADADVRAGEVVRALDLPHRLPNIAAVVALGDRPERVVRLDRY